LFENHTKNIWVPLKKPKLVLAALVPQIFHSLHKITHFLTGYINSYYLL
jgi:hypothetical protein